MPGFPIYIMLYSEFAPLQLDLAAPGTWLLAFLAYDFLYYWLHRAHHRIGVLWAVHEVHHSGEDMNFGLAIRQPILGELTSWPFFTPLALLGIPPEIFLAVSGVQVLYQYSLHNSYVPRLGMLEKWLQTPALHRVHHASNAKYIDRNYGNILAIWDRIFGTYQAEDPDCPPRYGLTNAINSWNPWVFNIHFFQQLLVKSRYCETSAERFLCWFAPPGWEPHSRPVSKTPDPVTRPKFDVRLTTSALVYCVLQFAGILAVFVLLLWNLQQASVMLSTTAVLVLLLGTYELGKLLEGNTRAWSLQLMRLISLLIASTLVGLSQGWMIGLMILAGFVFLSAGILIKVFEQGVQPPVEHGTSFSGV
ncbi:MAG: sterol desaturase family protein [Xanthomonadaceae bacterium]|nr:sterol desaturase family protein [Xanthomonadaceae bacterium]